MGGGRKAPPRKRPARARRRKQPSRLRPYLFAVLAGAAGAAALWFVSLNAEVSSIFEQRRTALSSSIFATPHRIRAGDDLERSRLLHRLAMLSYSRVPDARNPGEYSLSNAELRIFVRAFRYGTRRFGPRMVRARLSDGQIDSLSDEGAQLATEAIIEPMAIGRIIPGTSAERVEVKLENQKPYLVEGLLATEDQLFFWHPGFNPLRIVAAAIEDIRARSLVAGASTLTQQLARTFMERRERTFARKFRELAMALVLEARLSKKKILELYINEVSLGAYEGAPIHGMPQAARYFFNKDLGQITPAEAATLIGMVKAPTQYDPRRFVEASTRRRNVVLGVMRNEGVIDDAAYETAIATPIQLMKPPGLRRAPYFTDYVIQAMDRIPSLPRDRTGLAVYTTLDAEIQSDAVEALDANIARLEKSHKHLRPNGKAPLLQTSAVVLDSRSGAIRAMVGGRDYSDSQFNRAASALRQPGSAFKPIVYLAAMDPARSPVTPVLTLASKLPNQPRSFGGWTPANYERSDVAEVTAIRAISESLNIPAAYVGSRLGGDVMVRTAHELGIEQKLDPMLSIAIGAEETTLLELAATYQVLANSGTRSRFHAIESVVDADDREIWRHEREETPVVAPAVSYVVTSALEMVLKSGTGASAARLGLDLPAAGKTGTTQDYRDALFLGYTPELVCGVWLGFDVPKSIGLTGGQAALPAWVQIMQQSAPSHPRDFTEPDGIEKVMIDPETGGRATVSCSKRLTLPFLAGTAPDEPCPLHGDGFVADLNWGGWEAVEPTRTVAAAETKKPNVFRRVGKFFGDMFRR